MYSNPKAEVYYDRHETNDIQSTREREYTND